VGSRIPDLFAEALAHYQAGRLELALSVCRGILTDNADHAGALNLQGQILAQRGRFDEALESLEKAVSLGPAPVTYFVHLASARRRKGHVEKAIDSCRIALEIAPNHAEAHAEMGLALQEGGRLAEAQHRFRWLANSLLRDPLGPRLLGDCLRLQGRAAEALNAYREAWARDPKDGVGNLNLGTIYLGCGEAGLAESFLRQATQLLPQATLAWNNLGSCLLHLGREHEALLALQEALRLSPNDVDITVNIGLAWLGCGQNRAAENCFQSVLKRQPEHAGAISGMAGLFQMTERSEEAVSYYERALQLKPAGDAYKGLSQALWDTGDVNRAVAVLVAAAQSHPGDADDQFDMGFLLASAGDVEGATAAYRAALQLRPGFPLALARLAEALRGKLPEADRLLLEQALSKPLDDYSRAAVHFGLAQVYDGLKQFDRAAEHLTRANAIAKARQEAHNKGYNLVVSQKYVDRLIETFNAELFTRVEGFGSADERPVFVFGMPRSGTTLIEQILASHPRVFGAGERKFGLQSLEQLPKVLRHQIEPLSCLQGLTRDAIQACANWHLDQLHGLDGGQAVRVVDKMPDNFLNVGWLAILFPKARFIHARRDVRDVALSCWMTNFLSSPWARALDTIAARIRDYQRIMAHWRKVVPTPILDVDYERLVADQEGESRKLVAWLGLDWDPACLEFHRSQRLVKTASVTQVRQPIYSRSVGRWKHYQTTLAPLLDVLDCRPS
jgi:tetratricopeptide (TPR) repeat protein